MEELIKKIIKEIYDNIESENHALNERYIHHYFTKRIQEEVPITFSKLDEGLHPEWPTFKKSIPIDYGKYRFNKNTKKYETNTNGTAGFIDFCIGKYNKPQIAIEFLHKFGWTSEDVIFDFMKLLDKVNPFEISFSFILISREKNYQPKRMLWLLKKKSIHALKLQKVD